MTAFLAIIVTFLSTMILTFIGIFIVILTLIIVGIANDLSARLFCRDTIDEYSDYNEVDYNEIEGF